MKSNQNIIDFINALEMSSNFNRYFFFYRKIICQDIKYTNYWELFDCQQTQFSRNYWLSNDIKAGHVHIIKYKFIVFNMIIKYIK